MYSLNGEKILYFSPTFFGYEKAIKTVLENQFGAQVDFYDDRPSNDIWTKIFIRLNLKSFIQRKINTYYNTIFDRIKNISYNYVFIVSPETLSYHEIQQIKMLQPHAKFILYMWDSFQNKNSFNTITLFDRVFTFDPHDAKSYDLIFHPLFYIENYTSVAMNDTVQYDICSIATAHSDRYAVAQKVKEYSQKLSLRMFNFLYLNSKLMYWGRRIFLAKYQYGSINDFSFTPLSQNEIVSIIAKSKAILDINHPSQVGLTMRTFEALGAQKKLITTNKNITSYDFYNENNILVIERTNPILNIDFFNTPYQSLTPATYEKYSLYNWIQVVFNTGALSYQAKDNNDFQTPL